MHTLNMSSDGGRRACLSLDAHTHTHAHTTHTQAESFQVWVKPLLGATEQQRTCQKKIKVPERPHPLLLLHPSLIFTIFLPNFSSGSVLPTPITSTVLRLFCPYFFSCLSISLHPLVCCLCFCALPTVW